METRVLNMTVIDCREKGDVLQVAGNYTPEEERQVLRKIDMTILPLICIVFFMQVIQISLGVLTYQ